MNWRGPFLNVNLCTLLPLCNAGRPQGQMAFQVSFFFLKHFRRNCPLFCFLCMVNPWSLPYSQKLRQAVTSLLHQKGRSKLECSSYWPISLLNMDSKIFAKILAHLVVPSVVSDDQMGFIKNWYSFYHICRLLTILHHPTPPPILQKWFSF